MKNPLGLSLELPRKGSRMTCVFDPAADAFLLAEQMASGKLVVHERLDALAMLDVDAVREYCLRAGAAWSSSAELAATQEWQRKENDK
jgi:hypothetical protein